MNLPANDTEADAFKLKFEQTLLEYEQQHQGSRRKPWSQQRINEVINQVKHARMPSQACSRTSMDYYWMSKYDVMTNDNEDHLIFKKKSNNDPTVRIIPREAYFDYIDAIHKSCGHGGRDKMLMDIKNRLYIPKKAIEIYNSLCQTCDTKRSVVKKTLTSRKQEYNVRGHVEVIDFQSCPDGDYKWLLLYHDIGSMFVSLRPLKTDNVAEVSLELIKIFSTFGAPSSLQSDRERVFTEKVIGMCSKWWGNQIVYENPQPLENSVTNIKNMIGLWMTENNSTNWSFGCYFVQYKMNTSFNCAINKSPYKSVFNLDPNINCVICNNATSGDTVCALCKTSINESCSVKDEDESKTMCKKGKRIAENGEKSKKIKIEIEVDISPKLEMNDAADIKEETE